MNEENLEDNNLRKLYEFVDTLTEESEKNNEKRKRRDKFYKQKK